MIYTDQHVHTDYSPDGEGKVKDYIIKGKEMGLDYIIFTDHADFGTKDKDFIKHINYDKYFAMMRDLENQYGIPIKVGVEIGYQINYKKEIDVFLNKYPFDFVISSLHYGDGKDFYWGDFTQGKSQHQAYLRYFEILLEMVENFNNYDVVGHLDFIIRYGPYKNKSYKYSDYKEIIDRILKAIILNGKGIEVNTSGIRGGFNSFFPQKGVLARYKELGGDIVTIGSDTHTNKDYFAGIKEGLSLLKSLGFNHVSYFINRMEKKLSL